MNDADFYTKLSKFVDILTKQDWTPDGNNDKQGYGFVSHKKMKRNVAKAISDSGLIWDISFENVTIGEPIGTMKQHYTVKAVAHIRDICNPDRCMTYQAYGEAADSGDKALAKAQTSGFKAIINNNFFIADIDAEGEEIIENNDTIKAQSESGYEAHQQIVRERVARKMNEPIEGNKPTPSVIEVGITDSQRKVIDKIISKARTMGETELLPFGSLIQIEGDLTKVKSSEDAMMFIQTYTGVLRCP